ncbi:MAG TPA: hypothetical protein VI756_26055 [Blastocatellia bacterium]
MAGGFEAPPDRAVGGLATTPIEPAGGTLGAPAGGLGGFAGPPATGTEGGGAETTVGTVFGLVRLPVVTAGAGFPRLPVGMAGAFGVPPDKGIGGLAAPPVWSTGGFGVPPDITRGFAALAGDTGGMPPDDDISGFGVLSARCSGPGGATGSFGPPTGTAGCLGVLPDIGSGGVKGPLIGIPSDFTDGSALTCGRLVPAFCGCGLLSPAIGLAARC